jgi:hypothetical protein
MPAWLDKGVPAAGVFAGPIAWLANTQLNYALVPWVCAHQIHVIPAVAFCLAALSLAGAFLSWRAWAPAVRTPGDGGPRPWLAGIGLLVSLLFTLVILVQGSAGLVFHGCER